MSVPMRIEDLENMLSRSPKTTPSRLNGNQARNIRREKAEAPGGGGARYLGLCPDVRRRYQVIYT